MPYRRQSYIEQIWYLCRFRIKEVLTVAKTVAKKKRGKCGK